jgi:hypothetical protein
MLAAARPRYPPTVPASRPLVRHARQLRTAAAALVTFAACTPDGIRAPTAPADPAAFVVVPVTAGGGGMESPSRLDFATYDGSREVVHPDVVRAPDALGGKLWSVVTPYPNSQSKYENPSLFESTSGETWTPPAATSNPLATTTRGYLSDPDVVYDAGRREMRMYYREVMMSGKRHLGDNVYFMTSANGARWSTPTLATVDRGRYLVSPAVVRDSATAWRMWAIDAGPTGCDSKETKLVLRRSTDGKEWSAPTAVRFTQRGYQPWHVDVQWVAERKEYWALVAAYPKGSACTSTSLFLATSPDGESWTTFAAPVLGRGVVPQFATNVYRSSLLYDAGGTVTLWMSGARTVAPATKKLPATLEWTAGVARTTADALLARVNGPAPLSAVRSGPPIVLSVGNDVP